MQFGKKLCAVCLAGKEEVELLCGRGFTLLCVLLIIRITCSDYDYGCPGCHGEFGGCYILPI